MEWSYVYSIEHSTPPAEVGTAVASSEIECAEAALVPTPAMLPVIQDVCGNVLTPLTAPTKVEDLDELGTGTITYTYDYEDCAELPISWTYTYNVEDITPPEITAPAAITVTQRQDKGPYITGIATATDNCGEVTITFSDNKDGLNLCNATGTLVRTWTATDIAGNSSSATQDITVTDTESPVLVIPEDITVSNDAGVCEAVVNWDEPTATDFGHFQGFENEDWVSNVGTDWIEYTSPVVRVVSGTDEINSKTGSAHAVITEGIGDYTGAFSSLGGSYNSFVNGFVTSVDVYVDLTDSKVLDGTYGWDVTTAANNQAGSHLRDFIFHAAGEPGKVLIAGSNNSNFARRGDLATLDNYAITESGWYTFEWNFRDAGDGSLAVDLILRDASGVELWRETRNTPTDEIASLVGGNRYMWFTFLSADKLAIDNTTLTRKLDVTTTPVNGSTFAVGEHTVTVSATDDCGKTTTETFAVTVDDTELPTMVCQNITVNLDATGNASITAADVDNGSTDNCGIASSEIDVNSFDCGDVGAVNTVTLTITDIHANENTCESTVTVVDNVAPVAVCKNRTIELDANGAATIVAADLDNGSSDACGIASTAIDVNSFDCDNVGDNDVELTVIDVNGNVSTCTSVVTVVDAMSPEITAEADDVTSIVSDGCTAPMPDFTLTTSASDNCGVELTQSIDAGEMMDVGIHIVTVTATDPSANSVSFDVEFTVSKATISGTVLYNNTAQTPMGNVTLKLTPGDVEVTTDVNDGTYQFTGQCAGTYTIEVINNNKDAGYINSTDAGAANKWGTSSWLIELVQFLAGDVIQDNSITGLDALAIQNYFVYGTGTDLNPKWAYGKKGISIDNNSSVNASITVVVSGDNKVQDIYAMCTGDFNGSFEPNPTKSASSELVLITEDNFSVNENQEFELPLLANQTMEVGAVSMIVDIPTDLVEVLEVNVIGSTEPVSWLLKDGELRIGWNSQNAVNVFADEALLSLKLKTTKDFTFGKFMEVDLVYDPLNELADGNFEVINNVELKAAKVGNGLIVVDEELTIDELTFKNYPNPFHNTTNISYALPVDGRVNISVYNQLGQLVTTLVDANQSTGEYTIRDCGSELVPGIYIAKLRLTNEGVDRVGTIKLSVLE
jgi:hypothetical protein